MANIRITALPADTSPNAADVVPIDNATTRKTTLTNLVNAGRPFASQPEAEAGTSPTKGMSPLTTAQAIAAIGGAAFAATARGLPAGGSTNQILGKASGSDYDVSWRNSDANLPFEMVIACSDETTALTTGTAKVSFRMPRGVVLTSVRASLVTAQASGSIFTVDINEAGSTILSTKLTVDNTEKTSVTATTPAVISDSALADDALMTIDIDQVGDGTATGLKIALIGTRP